MMSNQVHPAVPFEQEDAVHVAQIVRQDLGMLLGILQEQLGSLSVTDSEARSHLAEAKTAAERGIELSDRLVEMLRRSADG